MYAANKLYTVANTVALRKGNLYISTQKLDKVFEDKSGGILMLLIEH